jgi:hypothetical protein
MTNIFKKETSSLLSNTLTNIAEGITGLAASEKSQLVFSIGHLFQSIRGGQFLSVLEKEWKNYRDAGRIKDDYQYSDQCYTCLHEILDFLENDIPDDLRFTLLKQIFLVSATEQVSNRESALPQQYMRICKTLTSGEILVLNATYEASRDKQYMLNASSMKQVDPWLAEISKRSGLKHIELVDIHENGLVEKKLLTPRFNIGYKSILPSETFRLTGLAYDICEFLKSYKKA